MEKKKFKNYYIEGIKNSYKSLYKRKTNLFKYYICVFIYILSIPLFLLKPVINIGMFRLGNQINDDNDIDLTTITKPCDNPKNYFTALFAGLIKLLIIIGVIIVLASIAGLLALVGYIFMVFTNSEEYWFLILFASPALLAIVIYLLFVPLIYVETGYIVNANNDINASNVINISFNAYKKEGKKIRFGIIVINFLIKIVYLALAGFGTALPTIILGDSVNHIGFSIICALIALIPFIIFAPLFTLATISSITMLNDDVVKDTLTEALNITNVKFTIPKKDIESLSVEEKLVYMFDNADGFKPSIKDLRMLDSLETVSGDNISEETIEKDETKNIPFKEEKKKIKEEIIEEKVVEEKETETNKEQNFEAIKEASEENITDSIIEDINSEKVSDEVVEKLDSELTSDESKDFEAIKEVSGDASDDVSEENKTIDETVVIEDVTNDHTEEVQDEIVEEPKEIETQITDESINEVSMENDIDEFVEETSELNDETEPVKEPIVEENKDDNIGESTIDNKEEIALESDNLEKEKQEEIENEIDDFLNPKEEISEEDFDMDLFKEENNNDDEETLKEMEDFLKKGDD